MVVAAGVGVRRHIISRWRRSFAVGPDLPSWRPLCVFQVKSLLLSRGAYGRSMLVQIASGGNIGMWAAMVDVLKKEGLLEEVCLSNSRTSRCSVYVALWDGTRRFSLENRCLQNMQW